MLAPLPTILAVSQNCPGVSQTDIKDDVQAVPTEEHVRVVLVTVPP